MWYVDRLPALIVSYGVTSVSGWTTVIAHRPDVLLLGVDLFENHCVISERADAIPTLKVMDLRDNQVSDLSPLSGMTELRYTMLEGNKVTDLGVLVAMAKKDAEGDRRFAPYWFLYLKGNPLTETVEQYVWGEERS